jgi:hypothetical protein
MYKILAKNKEAKYKNIACKIILGTIALSLGVCVVDYFFMEQKLLQPVKDILPQDNFTKLAIAAVLTIITVYAVFQLFKSQKEPPALPSSTINGIANGSVANGYMPSSVV